MDLSLNQLTGKIPFEFSNFRYTDTSDFPDNQLSGELPAELGDINESRGYSFRYGDAFGRILRVDFGNNNLS